MMGCVKIVGDTET